MKLRRRRATRGYRYSRWDGTQTGFDLDADALLEEMSDERRQQLDEMPPDLAGRVQALQSYDFMDDAARQHFEELMDELRQQLLQSYFNQMCEGMRDVSPEQMQRMKDMLAELNHMLEQRERGE